MLKVLKLNKTTESDFQKLRPLMLWFKIQFGQNAQFKNKLIKNWIKNTKSFKRRRKTGLVNPPHPRYHYKRLRSSLKFYKFMFLKYKPFKFLKTRFFFGNFGWFKKNLNLKFSRNKQIALLHNKLNRKKKALYRRKKLISRIKKNNFLILCA